MATYFIGDVHGCYDELLLLLKKIHFDRKRDTLVFVGDLINRGPNSLAVLRFVRDLGNSAKMVLGNHDLSFLAYAFGVYHGRGSDFPEMLKAKDSQELLEWLRQQPLMIYDEILDIAVTHAGIPPRWSIEHARKQARKATKKLRSDEAEQFLRYAYEKHQDQWHSSYNKYDKFRYRLNGFARLRYCREDGEPDFNDKCPPGLQTEGLQSWFELRKTMQEDGQTKIIFGHWAALGYFDSGNAICIDSGCAWGGQLSAIELTNKGIKQTQVLSRQKR